MFDIRPFIKPLAIAAAIALVWGTGFYSGQKVASTAAASKLQAVQLSHEQERSRAADAKAGELATALAGQQKLAEQANKLGWELLQTRSQLATTQTQLKQRIADATQSDGDRFTGLGPGGLRLYSSALGYPERNPGLPAANAGDAANPGQTGAAGAGLQPADLIAHAADYGAWCQQLEAQLGTLAHLHGGAPTQ